MSAFDYNHKEIEEALSKFNFKPKISGGHMHNFAGVYVNFKTGEETSEKPEIAKVNWAFYSNGNPHQLVLFERYHKNRGSVEAFVIYKEKNCPRTIVDSNDGWLYLDEWEKNLTHVEKLEKQLSAKERASKSIRDLWLYDNPAFYNKKKMEQPSPDTIYSFLFRLSECEKDCFFDSVDFERARALQEFLGFPIIHKLGFRASREQRDEFAKKVWNSLIK